eukprot:jgi/Mesvir1/18036/Mv09356-RA.2
MAAISAAAVNVAVCARIDLISTPARSRNVHHGSWRASSIRRLGESARLGSRNTGSMPLVAAASSAGEAMGITENEKARLNSLGGVMTDETVPEGHQGLHGFLYGEGGAEDAHGNSKTYVVRPGEDDGANILPLEAWVNARTGERPAGVYAVYAKDGSLQHVGYSRSVVASLRQHLDALGATTCASVRVKVITDASLITRARLEAEVDQWVQRLGNGVVPPGNGPQAHLWGRKQATPSAMSPEELREYEEKKLKLRKAMGENLYDDVQGETPDAKTRRLRLLQAVEGDDWSAVINEQTQATIGGAPASPAASGPVAVAGPPSEQIVSPFARPGAPDMNVPGGAPSAAPRPMNKETVDRALEEVRPFLIADGGNVEVVGVESGIIALRLNGACGTCPSSTATMKMGIERSLRAAFGDQLKEVVQVDKAETGATVEVR